MTSPALMLRERTIERIDRQKSDPNQSRFRWRELVMYDLTLSKGAKVLYEVLDAQGRKTGSCEISQLQLSELTGSSVRSIKRYLAELSARDLVRRKRAGYEGTNCYFLAWPDCGPTLSSGAKTGPSVGPKLAPVEGSHLYYLKENLKEEKDTQSAREEPPDSIPPRKPREIPGNPILPGPVLVNGHSRDETFRPFTEAARQFWGSDLIEEDLSRGWLLGWKKLDFEQKLLATQILRQRIEAGENPRYVKRLPRYLEDGDWKRPPRAPEVSTRESSSDRLIRVVKQRLTETGRM